MIDKQMESRVWQRIYGRPQMVNRRYSREKLRQCLRREEINFQYYDSLRMDETYGPAFGRLADDAMEHMKMLRQILRRCPII